MILNYICIGFENALFWNWVFWGYWVWIVGRPSFWGFMSCIYGCGLQGRGLKGRGLIWWSANPIKYGNVITVRVWTLIYWVLVSKICIKTRIWMISKRVFRHIFAIWCWCSINENFFETNIWVFVLVSHTNVTYYIVFPHKSRFTERTLIHCCI